MLQYIWLESGCLIDFIMPGMENHRDIKPLMPATCAVDNQEGLRITIAR